jgi:hypothetical protein
MSDLLEQVLREADATAPRVQRKASAEGVFEQVARRRLRRVTTRAVALLVVVGATMIFMLPRSAPVKVAGPIAPSEPTIEALNAEADRREALVNRLLEIEMETRQAIALRRRGAQRDPLEDAQQQMEGAAFAMVYQANRIAETVGQDPARSVYREVVAYFPQTESAQVARQRLTP